MFDTWLRSRFLRLLDEDLRRVPLAERGAPPGVGPLDDGPGYFELLRRTWAVDPNFRPQPFRR